jgi:hypothetical protein
MLAGLVGWVGGWKLPTNIWTLLAVQVVSGPVSEGVLEGTVSVWVLKRY